MINSISPIILISKYCNKISNNIPLATMIDFMSHIFIKFSVSVFSKQKKNCIQSDVRFCKNEGSNIFKINVKGGQLDRKLIQNA